MAANDEVIDQLHTLRDYVRWGASRLNEAGVFFGHGTDNAVDESLQLVLHALNLAPGLPSEMVHGRVHAVESDLFAALRGRRYELIVSNPPYVSEAEMTALPAEYRHEPALGLAAGEEGLDVVRRILREAGDYLSDDGLLVVEVGNSEAALLERYPEVPFIWPDFARGGGGVFLLESSNLRRFRHLF